MPLPQLGEPAPDFSIPTDDGKTFTLSEHLGRAVVLYFYPEDDTEGCTLENVEFTDLYDEFKRLGVAVFGISPDSVARHCTFRDKYKLRVPLGSDPERAVIEAYGLWQMKKMFGVSYMGVKRASIVIDAAGKVADIILAPKIRGHAQKVLDRVKALPAI